MSNITKLKKNPSKVLAIELLAFHPDLSLQQVADKVGVSKDCISKWKQLPEFVDAVYDRYMMQFGLEIPHVLDSMIREAKAGNVQAGRLVLEHSGKLVKNINVTIDSPFEKFLKNVPNAEVVEDSEVIDAAVVIDSFDDLPERNVEDQGKRVIKERAVTKDIIKKADYNVKQKKWYMWRKRAKAVGIAPLKGRRPTPAQRQEWEKSIIEAERLADTK
nr:hypothetical protein [uncultured Mediterranean phage uvMED]